MVMKKGYFITGTDTGVGKTWLTVGLMDYFKRQNKTVAGMKPVAAGCEWRQNGWKNEDALLLQAHASIKLPYSQVNPYAFKLPVSPHVACEGKCVDINRVQQNLEDLWQQAEVVLVEGAGGWYSPLSETLDNRNLAESLKLPVILVVAIRLGCINQALLSWRAIQASTIECAGWVAMLIEPDMPKAEDNIRFIQTQITDVPLLAVVPFQSSLSPEDISQRINGFW
jgi:dethiobiotin synthetase